MRCCSGEKALHAAEKAMTLPHKKNLKPSIFYADDDILNRKKDDFRQAFEAGETKTIISPQKQARHQKGTKQFAEYSAKLAMRGDYPSYIIPVKELQGGE